MLVAGSGVATVRVLRELQARDIKAVSLHCEADASALHATTADESVLLGTDTAAYGDPVKVVEAARQVGAQAVHPAGSQVEGLEDAVAAAGLQWLGHDPSAGLGPATSLGRDHP